SRDASPSPFLSTRLGLARIFIASRPGSRRGAAPPSLPPRSLPPRRLARGDGSAWPVEARAANRGEIALLELCFLSANRRPLRPGFESAFGAQAAHRLFLPFARADGGSLRREPPGRARRAALLRFAALSHRTCTFGIDDRYPEGRRGIPRARGHLQGPRPPSRRRDHRLPDGDRLRTRSPPVAAGLDRPAA